MKTVEQILDKTLSVEEFNNFKRNLIEYRGIIGFENFLASKYHAASLQEAFIWRTTPERAKYWIAVFNKLQYIKNQHNVEYK